MELFATALPALGEALALIFQPQQIVFLVLGVLLGLSESPPEDAADALAVALCHHHTSGTLERLANLQ